MIVQIPQVAYSSLVQYSYRYSVATTTLYKTK